MVTLGEGGLTLFQQESFKSPVLNFLFSAWGAGVVQALSFWPIPTLLVSAALSQLDRSLVDLVRLEGGSIVYRAGLFVRLIAPALALSGVLVILFSLNDVGAAELLQVHTFPVLLYSELNLLRSVAGLLPYTVPLLGFLGILLAAGWVIRSRLTVDSIDPFAHRSDFPVVGGGATLFLIACLIVLGPGISIISQLDSLLADWNNIPFHLIGEVAVTSIWVAVGSTLLAMLVLAALLPRSPSRGVLKVVEGVSFLFFVFPAPLLGLLGIRLIALTPAALMPVTDSFLVLSVACAVKFFWPAWALVRLGLARVNSSLLDQARLDGLDTGLRSIRLKVALISPFGGLAILSVWVMTLGEVTLCRILQPPGIQTLAVRTVNFMHWGHDGLIAASLAVLAGIILAPVILRAAVRSPKDS